MGVFEVQLDEVRQPFEMLKPNVANLRAIEAQISEVNEPCEILKPSVRYLSIAEEQNLKAK